MCTYVHARTSVLVSIMYSVQDKRWEVMSCAQTRVGKLSRSQNVEYFIYIAHFGHHKLV